MLPNLRRLLDHEETGEPLEYVADDLGSELRSSDGAPLTDLDAASEVLVDLIERRIRAVFARGDELPLGLLLSGGIDSILVAACAAKLGLAPSAVTVVATDDDGTTIGSEDERGAIVAAHLGITHTFVRMTPGEVATAARDSVRRLGVSELWEVTSAIPTVAAIEQLDRSGTVGPALTGAGADALFLGGYRLVADPATPEGMVEFRDRVTAGVRSQFIRERLVPDYDERLLGEKAGRFVRIFQTRSFWEFAQVVHPSLLWRAGPDGRPFDKYLLRYTAERMGIPSHLVFTTKSPLQVSSGTVAALLLSARRRLADRPANRVYADPMTEPVEHTAVRLFLDELGQADD